MTARKYAPICSYPGCGRPHNSHGLCNSHGIMRRKGETLRPVQDRTGPIETPALDRFMSRVSKADNGCWEWTGGKTRGGYGTFAPTTGHNDSTKTMAHRWSYAHFVGPIPNGLDIDHLCRNRACVNPEHLEAVTRAENIRRAYALRTHCSNGHELTEDNTRRKPGTNQRGCRTCQRAYDVARRGKRNARRRLQRELAKKAA